MAAELKKQMEQKGWHLSEDGIEICKEELGSESKSCDKIIKVALDIDIADIGEKYLPEEISKGKLKEFKGPCVLQVVKTRNISAPKVNETSNLAPRMLQVILTDGHKTCVAIEMEKITKISLDTAPGTKLCLTGIMEIRNGIILLRGPNVTLLGGVVENLRKKWIAAKEASGFSRMIADTDEPPPPFVDFGKKISYKYKSTSSLPKSKNENDGEPTEFNEQRQAAIAQVQKDKFDSSTKTFAPGTNKPNITSQRNFDQPKSSQHQSSSKSSEVYRDTSANTKSVTVDDSMCNQLVQMGFPRQEASSALIRTRNNLEAALESLISPNTNQPSRSSGPPSRSFDQQPRSFDQQPRSFDQQPRSFEQQPRSYDQRSGDGRGRRDRGRGDRDRRGGRGGGRGRGGRRNHEDDEDDQRSATSSTLFDFLESKISKPSKRGGKSSTAPTSSSAPLASSRAGPSHSNHQDAYDEDESLMQYVRELSLVETKGGGFEDTTGGDYHFKSDSSHNRKEVNPVKQNSRDQDYNKSSNDRRTQNSSQGPRQNLNSNRLEENRDRRVNGQQRQTGERRDRGDPDQRDSYNSDKRGKSYRDTRGYGQPNPRGDHFHPEDPNRGGFDDRLRHDNPPRHTGDVTTGPRQQERHQNDVPPRFRKNQPNKHQDSRNDSRPTTNQSAPRHQNANPSTGRKLTLGDTAKNLKPETKEPPALQPPHNGPIVTWQKGAVCQAKYWEDGQFYNSVVIDVHHHLPFAVVQFLDFGNCEEVAFADIRPQAQVEVQIVPSRADYNPTDHIKSQEFRGKRTNNQYSNQSNQQNSQRVQQYNQRNPHNYQRDQQINQNNHQDGQLDQRTINHQGNHQSNQQNSQRVQQYNQSNHYNYHRDQQINQNNHQDGQLDQRTMNHQGNHQSNQNNQQNTRRAPVRPSLALYQPPVRRKES